MTETPAARMRSQAAQNGRVTEPIPFTVTILKDQIDKELPDKLLTEAEGVLAWAVEGARLWYAGGLAKPAEVEAAKDRWREDMDQLGRFIDEPCNYPAFGADMYADFAELGRERDVTDRKMLDWAGGVTAAWLAAPLSYVSKVDGRRREMPRAIAVLQLFNHGTHHRGQLTTLIRQAGRDPGVTDIPWLPGVVRTSD